MSNYNLPPIDPRTALDLALGITAFAGLFLGTYATIWALKLRDRCDALMMAHVLLGKTSNNLARLVCHKLGISEQEARGIIEQIHNEAAAEGKELD